MGLKVTMVTGADRRPQMLPSSDFVEFTNVIDALVAIGWQVLSVTDGVLASDGKDVYRLEYVDTTEAANV